MLRNPEMYNLKVSTAAGTTMCPGAGAGPGAGMLGVDFQGLTPRTPEILNSLIAMSNPLESYPILPTSTASAPELNSPSGALSDCSSCSGSVTSPPSVQHTRSQLIKEGLKLTLQTKRRHTSPADNTNTDDDEESSASGKRQKRDELTAEDEERRRRRRERNKVAATKCRIKKRERTVNLVQESEILESQNYELKSQIQELETQRRRLVDMLSTHTPTCTRPARGSPGEADAGGAAFPYEAFPTAPYSCPSPSDAHAPAAPAPGPYGDLLMDPYCPDPRVLTPLDPMVNVVAARGTPPLTTFYPVTKHEVPDDSLLTGFEDDLNALAGESAFGCGPPSSASYCGGGGSAPQGPGGVGLSTHGMAMHHQQQVYCRPSRLALDPHDHRMGPGSSSSSLESPGGPGPMPMAYQHFQHPQLATHQLLHQDGTYGIDSGCMA